MTKDNHQLGKFDLTNIPPAPRGVPQSLDLKQEGSLVLKQDVEVTTTELRRGSFQDGPQHSRRLVQKNEKKAILAAKKRKQKRQEEKEKKKGDVVMKVADEKGLIVEKSPGNVKADNMEGVETAGEQGKETQVHDAIDMKAVDKTEVVKNEENLEQTVKKQTVKEQKLDGKQEQKLDGKQEQELDGKQDNEQGNEKTGE